MILKIDLSESTDEPVVTIQCREENALVQQLITAIQMVDQKLAVLHEGQTILLPVSQILYIESVDRKCFVYSADTVYECSRKLYELAQLLSPCSFAQISKACLVNLQNVSGIRAHIDRRLLLTLQNGEQLIASRQYAPQIKERLGVN